MHGYYVHIPPQNLYLSIRPYPFVAWNLSSESNQGILRPLAFSFKTKIYPKKWAFATVEAFSAGMGLQTRPRMSGSIPTSLQILRYSPLKTEKTGRFLKTVDPAPVYRKHQNHDL